MKKISVKHATVRLHIINMTELLRAARIIKPTRTVLHVIPMLMDICLLWLLQQMHRMIRLPSAATVIQAGSMLIQYQTLSVSKAIQQAAH
jgi:hypothetical protein